MSLRRHAAHIDKAQPDIVKALRAAGCSVTFISKKGHPDLLVGVSGINLLLEVKSELEDREEKDGWVRKGKVGKLNEDQRKWHDAWRGQVATVRSVAHALAVVAEALANGDRPRPLANNPRALEALREAVTEPRPPAVVAHPSCILCSHPLLSKGARCAVCCP